VFTVSGERARYVASGFSPDGKVLATVDSQGFLDVFYVERNVHVVAGHVGGSGATCVCVGWGGGAVRGGQALDVTVGCKDGSLRTFSVPRSAESVAGSVRGGEGGATVASATLRGHRGPVASLHASQDGGRLVSSTADTAVVWSTGSQTRERALRAPRALVGASLAARSDAGDEVVVVAFRDDTIGAWPLGADAQLQRLVVPRSERGSGAALTCVACEWFDAAHWWEGWSPVVAAGTRSGSVVFWTLASAQGVRVVDLPSSSTAVVQVAFLGRAEGSAARDPTQGTQWAILGDDGAVLLVRLVADDEVRVLAAVGGAPGAVVVRVSLWVGRRGGRMACHMSDGSLALYDVDRLVQAAEQGRDAAPLEVATARRRLPGGGRALYAVEAGGGARLSMQHPRGPLGGAWAAAAKPDADTEAEAEAEAGAVRGAGAVWGAWARAGTEGAVAGAAPPDEDADPVVAGLSAATQRRRLQRRALVATVAAAQAVGDAETRGGAAQGTAHGAAHGLLGPLPLSAGMDEAEFGECVDRLRRALVGSGGRVVGFPADVRSAAWRFLLRLPSNEAAFEDLAKAGEHPSATAALRRFPIRDGRLARRMLRVLSAVAHWSPVVGACPYVPLTLFPFLSVFGGGQDLAALEFALTFFFHWGARWMQHFPHAPVPLLAACETALARTDPELARHLRRLRLPPARSVWPLLRSVLSEVLPRDQWLALWDAIVCHAADPALLPILCVAFLRYHRRKFLALPATAHADADADARGEGGGESAVAGTADSDAATILRTHQPTDLAALFRLARHVRSALPAQLWGGAGGDVEDAAAADTTTTTTTTTTTEAGAATLWPWAGRGRSLAQPLPRAASYPPFLRYPAYVVDFQLQERQRILEAEAALLERRRLLEERESRLDEERTLAEAAARAAALDVALAAERREADARGDRVRRATADALAQRERAVHADATQQLLSEHERRAADARHRRQLAQAEAQAEARAEAQAEARADAQAEAQGEAAESAAVLARALALRSAREAEEQALLEVRAAAERARLARLSRERQVIEEALEAQERAMQRAARLSAEEARLRVRQDVSEATSSVHALAAEEVATSLESLRRTREARLRAAAERAAELAADEVRAQADSVLATLSEERRAVDHRVDRAVAALRADADAVARERAAVEAAALAEERAHEERVRELHATRRVRQFEHHLRSKVRGADAALAVQERAALHAARTRLEHDRRLRSRHEHVLRTAPVDDKQDEEEQEDRDGDGDEDEDEDEEEDARGDEVLDDPRRAVRAAERNLRPAAAHAAPAAPPGIAPRPAAARDDDDDAEERRHEAGGVEFGRVEALLPGTHASNSATIYALRAGRSSDDRPVPQRHTRTDEDDEDDEFADDLRALLSTHGSATLTLDS
jgi:hypothetical protein